MAKDRRCLDDQSWEVAAMASAETVMAVYSDREDKGLESRMRSKDSCPVWGEGAGKVPDGNSPTPYSTSRPVLRGRRGASPGASPLRYSTRDGFRDLSRCHAGPGCSRQASCPVWAHAPSRQDTPHRLPLQAAGGHPPPGCEGHHVRLPRLHSCLG